MKKKTRQNAENKQTFDLTGIDKNTNTFLILSFCFSYVDFWFSVESKQSQAQFKTALLHHQST